MVEGPRPKRTTVTQPTTPLVSEAPPSVQQETPGFGRSILTWLAIATTTVLILVTGGMLLSGVSPASALGLGLFAAMWGGTGFGVMLGGVFHANRLETATPAVVAASTTAPSSAGQASVPGMA